MPAHWFKKYNIKPVEALGPREFIESAYAIRVAHAPKELDPIIINEPQRDGFTWEIQPAEEVKIEVIEKNASVEALSAGLEETKDM